MPSSSSAATTPNVVDRRREILEKALLQFNIQTGGHKYIARVMDRPTLERHRSSYVATPSPESPASPSLKLPTESGASSFMNK